MTTPFLARPAGSDQQFSTVTDTLAAWLPSATGPGPVAGWKDVEWQIAGWVAYWQNAIPWLAERIRQSGAPIPASIAHSIEEVEADSRERTRRMLDAVVEFCQAFESEDIQVILLKGAVLAAAYYPDPSSRPLADLDVLIRRQDLWRSLAILGELGYQFFSRSAEDEVYLRGQRTENVWSADNVHPVEVHYTLREEYAGIGYNLAEEMWANSRLAPFWRDYQALLPRPAALLHHVCAHATSDWLIQRGRLFQIDDLRKICAKMDEAEWERFARSVPPNGARFVYPALAFAVRYAHLEVPGPILGGLRASCPAKLLEWIESTGLSDNSEANPGDRSALGLAIARRLSNSPYDRARFWLRSLFPRRWNLSKRYPRLVETPFWMAGYLLLNVDRLAHIVRRRL
jgi:hypothetical protein